MGGYRRGIAPPAAGARQACERWGECDRVTLDGGNVKNWVKVLWVAVVTAISTIVVARLNSSTQGRAARDARVFEHRKKDVDELKESLVQLFALARRRLLAWREEVRVGVLFRQRSSGLVGQGEQVIALYEGRRTNYPRAPYPYRPPAPLTCARRPTSRTQRPSPFARARPCAREL